jgi:acyl carrier protein
MDMNEFIKKFTACLNHTPASAIGPDTEFKKLDEWSSIFALVVIAMVDSDYHKVLAADDLRNSKSLSDLFNLIQSR